MRILPMCDNCCKIKSYIGFAKKSRNIIYGVDDIVKFFRADARRIEKPDRRGTLVCNPPYGERLMTEDEVDRLYQQIGRNFANFDPWQMYVLTSSERFERLFGRRADKVRKLYNGMIPCNLYQYFKPKNK